MHVSELSVRKSPLLAQLAHQGSCCCIPLTEKAFRGWMEYSCADKSSVEHLCDVLEVLSVTVTVAAATEILCLPWTV